MLTKHIATALIGTALMTGAAFAQTATTPSTSSSPAATSTPAAPIDQSLKGNWRASKIVGLPVYNDSNERLGDINEVLLDNNGKISAFVIGVGGFLGMGERNVTMTFDKVKFINEPIRVANASADKMPGAPGATTSTAPATTKAPSTIGSTATTSTQTRDPWYPDHAVVSATKDQLKSAPEFRYTDYK